MSATMDMLDDIAGGPLTASFDIGRPLCNARQASEYARRLGKDPSDLTDEELGQFSVSRPIRRRK